MMSGTWLPRALASLGACATESAATRDLEAAFHVDARRLLRIHAVGRFADRHDSVAATHRRWRRVPRRQVFCWRRARKTHPHSSSAVRDRNHLGRDGRRPAAARGDARDSAGLSATQSGASGGETDCCDRQGVSGPHDEIRHDGRQSRRHMTASLARVERALGVSSRMAWLVAACGVVGVAAVMAIAAQQDMLTILLGVAALGVGVLLGLKWPILPLALFAALIPIEEILVVEGLGTLSRFAGILFAVTYALPRLGHLKLGAMPPAAWAYLAWAVVSVGWALDPGTATGAARDPPPDVRHRGSGGRLRGPSTSDGSVDPVGLQHLGDGDRRDRDLDIPDCGDAGGRIPGPEPGAFRGSPDGGAPLRAPRGAEWQSTHPSAGRSRS